MKSAYELALERMGGEPIRKLTNEQKAKIAEIDGKYQAKVAEAEFANKEKVAQAGGEAEKLEQFRKDLAVELASIREKCEREKEKIRKSAE